MNTTDLVRVVDNRLERLFDAVIDPARREGAMALLLCGYAAAWWLYAVISNVSQDIHFDMGEMFAWSHQVTLGTPKHPPLGAWLVRAWFSVMPTRPWAYYLFAVISATVALWIAWRISARYLSAEKRVVGLVLLTFVPFYNFYALRFNANAVLIPLWAVTTWFFLRSFETRRAGWAVLAGAGAAAAMLGKYWSIFLLAGLAIAAVTDTRRGAYLRSPAPWVTVAVFTLLFAPHVVWVVAHNLGPFHYALTAHPSTFAKAIGSGFIFIVGALGYIAAPIVFTLIAGRPGMTALKDMLWPAEAERRMIVIAFASPFLLAALTGILLQVRVGALWTMSGMTLLPVALLSSPRLTVSRQAAIRLLALAVVFPLLMVAVSPGVATVIHRLGAPHYASHYRLIARTIESAWRAQTNQPLRIVGSYGTIVNGIVFYLDDQPSTFDIVTPALTPSIKEDRIAREGMAIVCPQPETSCVAAMHAYAGRYAAGPIEIAYLARRHFGVLDRPVQYQILIIPPGSH
jgi:4-amino-4-deoxy-L-arabinose transferase-like glycosyltransferase